MKIVKFTKKKNGQYLILLEDDRKITLHEDLILKRDLLLKKEIDEEDIICLITENNNYLAYDNAIKYIGIKMRSISEVEEYLKKREIDEKIMQEIIEKLIKQGYLNDKIYSTCYVNDKINLSNDGPLKIVEFLRKNKIENTVMEEAISNFSKEIECEKIKKLINKQVKQNTNKGSYLLKQKILSNLVALGYHRELIVDCLNGFEFDEQDIYKREYKKIYDKLSKKYSGKELDYKLRQKLYQKGFSNVSIDE